jgi:CheY-like chemotaxis protein
MFKLLRYSKSATRQEQICAVEAAWRNLASRWGLIHIAVGLAEPRAFHSANSGGRLIAVMPYRVLVVEDFAPFRRFVSSMLRNRPEFEIIGEIADGLEAVEKAENLKPDLILLDIGLPTLNGFDVARRIRKTSPESKILFVTQETSADVVEKALELGSGFVAKSKAASDFLVAIETVLSGKRFIGSI